MGTTMADWGLKWQVAKHSRLGVGTFGTVFASIDKNMQAVAIKILRFTQAADAVDFYKEIASLELLRCHPHPNIIRMYDCVLDITDMSCGIAMELATMDLRKLLKSHAYSLIGQQLVAGVVIWSGMDWA